MSCLVISKGKKIEKIHSLDNIHWISTTNKTLCWRWWVPCSFQRLCLALATMAWWLELWPAHGRVAGSIPSPGGRNHSISVSQISLSPPLPHLPTSLLSTLSEKHWKRYPQGKINDNNKIFLIKIKCCVYLSESQRGGWSHLLEFTVWS